MLEIKGQYSDAIVFNDEVEATAIAQIYSFVNCKAFEGSKIRIMPDVHAGAGSVIGFTSTFTDKIVPNVVGVDICCGVASVNLGKLSDISFEKLDAFIRNNIPSGCTVRQKAVKEVDSLDLAALAKIVEQTGQKLDYVLQSVGTLGGGNHFMELDLDDNGDYWFTVHTGSRNFGLKVANYFQGIAKKEMGHSPGTMNGLEYIQGEAMANYIAASQMAYNFAQLSRRVILSTVAEDFFGERFNQLDTVETLHNYIDIKNSLIRKGAVAAYKGDRLIIPWNMRDGIIIGTGEGNEDWNCSAPHGAGRVMGRRVAKETLKIKEFRDTMQGVWSSCICPETIDESPMAYKEPEQIKKYIGDTMTIDLTMKPVYNYKAND